ncbi:MAG: hypothetical protein V3U50_01125 [Acidimicrobiia bacterium]
MEGFSRIAACFRRPLELAETTNVAMSRDDVVGELIPHARTEGGFDRLNPDSRR